MSLFINQAFCIYQNSSAYLVTQDNCYTEVSGQVIVIPYTNLALAKDAENVADTVFYDGKSLCHNQSYFSKSTGDEAGTLKGVVSGTIQGRAEFVTWSNNVFIEGQPAVHYGSLMVSNNKNTLATPVLIDE